MYVVEAHDNASTFKMHTSANFTFSRGEKGKCFECGQVK